MGRDGPEVKPERVTVVSITVNGKFRVDATINKENLLQRIHTWVADPVLGDMNYEHEFTNASYVDLGNGIRFPTEWHSHQGWDDNYGTQAASAGHNAFGGTPEGHQGEPLPGHRRGARAVRRATFPVRVETTKLADGVYLLGGGTHNSMAVEFRDFIAVFEAPLNEDRSLAVIEDVVRLMPGKPIRWLINSHQHFDHAGGLRTYMHIGATIVTHVEELRFLRARCAQLRAADAEARHGVAVAADRAGRRVLLRSDPGELHHQRRHAQPQRPLRQSAGARRRHADRLPAARAAAVRGGPRRYHPAASGRADERPAQLLQCRAEAGSRPVADRAGSRPSGALGRRPVNLDALRRDLQAAIEGEVRFDDDHARALFHRRQRLPDPAARRGGREVPRRRRADGDDLREHRCP